ncbi:MAG: amidohydrolase family protein [Deltaproteobacteria bacterium]|nr:amidohydrolase family protein [Deltaproteobacteria bacterium]
MFLKSSHIIPIEGPNLSPGYLCVRDGVIHAVGDEFVLSMQEKGEDFIDLGKMVLLPGFVNAHCHLELTAIGPIKPPPPPFDKGGERGDFFVSWIKELVIRKNSLTEDEKIDGIKKGIARLMHSGVTCIGDHISFNTPLEAIVKSPLKGRLFGEVLGVLPEVSEDIYATFKNRQKEFSQSASRFTLHASPHSVHAVDPDTLRRVLTEQPAPLSCHLAESKTEEEYFRTEKGVLARFIRERRHDIRHQGKSGLDYLEKQNLPLEKLLIVHGNYLTPEDLERIKKRSLSIVHCPGSHEYFGHESFPLAEYLAQGINVALGTDSIAGNTDLDFLKELRRVRKKFPALTALQILKAATLNGARALGLQDEIGSLVSGKKADIIGFLLSKNMNPEEAPFLANSVDWMMSGQRRDALCRE